MLRQQYASSEYKLSIGSRYRRIAGSHVAHERLADNAMERKKVCHMMKPRRHGAEGTILDLLIGYACFVFLVRTSLPGYARMNAYYHTLSKVC